jgi:exopolysaccharide biosynthesis polyprenyl glycosylphosphotransferase
MSQYVTNLDKTIESTLLVKSNRATKRIHRNIQWRLIFWGLIAVDLLMIGASFYFSFLLRFGTTLPIFQVDALNDPNYYRLISFGLMPFWVLIFAMVGLYNRQNLLGGTEEYSLVFRGVSLGIWLVMILSFVSETFEVARGWLLLAWPIAVVVVILGRFLFRRLIYSLRKRGYFLTPTIIVGGNQEGRWLAEQMLSWASSGLLLLGFVDDKVPPGTHLFRNLYSLGTVDQLDEIIQKYDVGEVVLATSAISSRNKQLEIFKRYGVSSNVNVRMSSGLYEIITTGITVSEFAYVPLVTINKARLTGFDQFLKLVLDYSLVIPFVILFSPLFLVLAIAVKLDSPGPIIHRRRVVGVNGKQFDAFKFRSMRIDGDKILDAHPELKLELATHHKLKNDPRVTRLGHFIRKYSLDELPQMFNVLRREMSLVGPRMITLEEVAKYNQWDMNLLTVAPGISGLWQVSGRSDVSYDERVQLDMYYVRNWSIWLDIQIVVQTIPAILKGRGAY